MSETQYDSFEEMMEDLGGITFDEAIQMNLTQNLDCLKSIKRNKNDVYELEEFGEYAAIFACHATDEMVKEIAKKFNLQIVTYCIGDSYSFSTGMHWVNREKYLFCRSKKEGWCEELE